MFQSTSFKTAPAQSLPLNHSADFVMIGGASLDDPLSFAAELLLDNFYELRYAIKPSRLSLITILETKFTIADDTEIGSVGAEIHLYSALTLMLPDDNITDAMVLVEVDETGGINNIYLLPLAPLSYKTNYNLVGINTDTATHTFAQMACVSFSRGMNITLASGEQRPIELLNIGYRVLTRDDGPQKVRWIRQSTHRAVDDFAPICI